RPHARQHGSHSGSDEVECVYPQPNLFDRDRGTGRHVDDPRERRTARQKVEHQRPLKRLALRDLTRSTRALTVSGSAREKDEQRDDQKNAGGKAAFESTHLDLTPSSQATRWPTPASPDSVSRRTDRCLREQIAARALQRISPRTTRLTMCRHRLSSATTL